MDVCEPDSALLKALPHGFKEAAWETSGGRQEGQTNRAVSRLLVGIIFLNKMSYPAPIIVTVFPFIFSFGVPTLLVTWP